MTVERHNVADSMFPRISGIKWKNDIKPGTILKPTFMSYPDDEFKTLLNENNILVAVRDPKTIELIYPKRMTSGGPWKHEYSGEEINDDFYLKATEFYSYTLPWLLTIIWRIKYRKP